MDIQREQLIIDSLRNIWQLRKHLAEIEDILFTADKRGEIDQQKLEECVEALLTYQDGAAALIRFLTGVYERELS